jgi:hypothetical protein
LDEGDLVEHDALRPRHLAGMVGATTLLQALERLAVARRFAQRIAARGDLDVVAVEVERSCLARLLDTLQICLVREQVLRLHGQLGGSTLRRERTDDLIADRAQALGAAGAPIQRTGKFLLGDVLTTLAQRAQAFEGKAKGAHGRCSRRRERELEQVDECSSGRATPRREQPLSGLSSRHIMHSST